MAGVDVKIFGAEALKRWAERAPEEAREAMREAMDIGLLAIERIAKLKVSGSTLKVRTGRLRASIGNPGAQGIRSVATRDRSVLGTIGTRVKYAAIHEHGGTIRIPEIRPRNKRALRFFVGGREIFAKRARAHDVAMPARPFLGPAVEEGRDQVLRIFGARIARRLSRSARK